MFSLYKRRLYESFVLNHRISRISGHKLVHRVSVLQGFGCRNYRSNFRGKQYDVWDDAVVNKDVLICCIVVGILLA